jgi:hypothetical protein
VIPNTRDLRASNPKVTLRPADLGHVGCSVLLPLLFRCLEVDTRDRARRGAFDRCAGTAAIGHGDNHARYPRLLIVSITC